MAPEIYNSEEYDYRADLFSTGVVLYYLCNLGEHPWNSQEDISKKKNPKLF